MVTRKGAQVGVHSGLGRPRAPGREPVSTVEGCSWAPLHPEPAEAPPTGHKRISPHAPRPARKCYQIGLHPGPHTEDCGVWFCLAENVCECLTDFLKSYKSRGPPPSPWWRPLEVSVAKTQKGRNSAFKGYFRFPVKEFSIYSFVLFFFFFSL